MKLSIEAFLIVCPLLFFAGFVDAIGGGGGLISLPAFLIAGIPPHAAIATNKLAASLGTMLTTFRFIKNKLVNFKLSIPSVIMAFLGSVLGANLSLLVDEKYMFYLLVIILPLSAFLVLNKKLFNDDGIDMVILNRRTYITAMAAAFFIGIYDGFYGPGTGTFLIIAFTIFAKLSIKKANAQAKVINLTTDLSSLTVYLLHGKVLIVLGLTAALFNMIGGYLGSGLVMRSGSKIVKPSIIFVLALLGLKVVGIY